MLNRADLVYVYDGSFEGLLCCVFESYERKEIPLDIVSIEEAQSLLWEERFIVADKERANRVFISITKKISKEAEDLIKKSFLTCLPNKEMHILHFLQLGYKIGSKIMYQLADDRVDILIKAVQHLEKESHLLLGFVRFSVFEDAMVAIIEPKNFVLPIIGNHFCDRYNGENFVIYDKTNKVALVHTLSDTQIVPVEQFEMPVVNAEELAYRRLWKQFYETIAIETRTNHKCCMTHMPKRYWTYMPELTSQPN